MNSIFSNGTWSGRKVYLSARADLLHHNFDPEKANLGSTCLVIFSSGLYTKVLEQVPPEDTAFEWPYSTTPLKLCTTPGGKKFCVHFPSYGGPRIANSLEQLAACGIRRVIGLGLGGTPRKDVQIGDVVLLEGSLRGDGVSRSYAPNEYPAVSDLNLTALLHTRLLENMISHYVGLSFGTDALYREEETLVDQLRDLGILTIDLESSAFLTVGRRLGLACAWTGVVSDRLVGQKHEGNIHSEHVMEKLLQLSGCIAEVIDALPGPNDP